MKRAGAEPSLLGVPPGPFILNLTFTALITVLFFLPSIGNFGTVLLGIEDMKLFVFMFGHIEGALRSGVNPLYIDDLFYPYGISLTYTAFSPMSSALYAAFPAEWGQYGKITVLQLLSFILGGVFSFALAYRFCRETFPSIIASIVFNFSVYHFEKAIHHLNYSMGMSFIPLFFLFWLGLHGKKGPAVFLLAGALFLITLNELLLAVMALFIAFIDIMDRYRPGPLFTPRNTVIMSVSVLASLLCYEMLLLAPIPGSVVLAYTLPSLVFFGPFIFLIIGPENLVAMEKRHGLIRALVLSSLPVFAYLAFIFVQPSYDFIAASVVQNNLLNVKSIEYLAFPSEFQALHGFGILPGLVADSESGLYIGIPMLALAAWSFLGRGASKEESRFRDLFAFCVLISFPLFVFAGAILVTPFFAQTIFPLLGLLRAPMRFIIFALLFLSVFAAIALARLTSKMGNGKKALVLGALALLLVAERMPDFERFVFSPPMPEFYRSLAAAPENASIFLYPNFDYYTLLDETYYQTIHGKALSYGSVSRFPRSGNQLYEYYFGVYGEFKPARDGLKELVRGIGY
ncbi:MAG: hypothetical protein AB1324_02610, partial [Candidatus Micrarchaeota archaeon]